jgi:peptide/nickel transport system ATP-binding protein
MSNAALKLVEVSRSFRVPDPTSVLGRKTRLVAVDRVSLTLGRGGTLGLVGESGCGKTTVGNIIAGHVAPESGSLQLEGTPLPYRRGRELSRSVQMIFQDPMGALDPRWPVVRQVQEPLDIFAEGEREERRVRAADHLRLVGLSDEQGELFPHQLSGGQRQRVVAARALILRPRILVCDEPVSALDVSIQAQILNLLMELQQEFHFSYLFISHDLRVVRHISHRVAVMYLGRIVEQAPAKRLFTRPAHPYTQALLSAVPQPVAGRRRKRIVLEGDPPSPLRLPAGCRFSSRCPVAMERCTYAEPPTYSLPDAHEVACYRAAES